MARSRHTEPPHLYVKGRFPVDAEGRPIFPRIVRRRPRPGDVHPIERKQMGGLMALVPPEYLYGLNRVELRPRVDEVGKPYGYYSPGEKFIVLYSTPLIWDLGPVSEASSRLDQLVFLESTGAEVRSEQDRLMVCWAPVDLEMFYIWQVVLHELGHHYSNQWKRRRKRPPWGRYQEIIAELHKQKLSARIIRKFLTLVTSHEENAES